MEAKDTVIPVLPHSESIWCPHCGEEFGIESHVEDERTMQAEISFKAGVQVGVHAITQSVLNNSLDKSTEMKAYLAGLKQEGIREVVDDIANEMDNAKIGYFAATVEKCLMKWQAFLKKFDM